MKGSIDLRRLKPYCQVGVWLVVIALSVELTLQTLDRTPVLSWVPKAVTGTGYLEDSRLRVAQTLQHYRENRIGPHEHLAVVVGVSEVREGIELGAMAEALGPQWRLLGLGGAGFGLGSIRQYANLVLASELRPDVAVLGFGLYHLVDYRPRPGVAGPDVVEQVRQGDVRSVVVALRNSTWTYARREDISVSVDFAVLELRARLLAAFGVALPDGDARKRSPWREMIKTDWPEHFSAATLKLQEQDYESNGIFDLERYEASPVATATLMGMIEQFHRRGARVVLLVMPQRSTLNQRIPSEALQVLQRQLRHTFPGNEPPLLDFRKAVEDSGFVDLPHLNRKGSLEFSQKLGKTLRELLPHGTPLMVHREERGGS
jgi:hypothetical protein